MTRSGLALAASLVLSGTTTISSAEMGKAPRPIETSFRAPAGCGDPGVLAQRFQTRLPELSLRFIEEAPIRITVAPSGDGAQAQLLILLQGGEELSRTIEAETCEAAIEAIAFVAAVALDPEADAPLRVRTQPTPRTREEEKPQESEKRVVQAPAQETASRFWSLGVFAMAHRGQAPDFLLGLGIQLETASKHSGWWAPSARLSGNYARRGHFQEEAGTARFAFMAASLDLCPTQANSPHFRLQACGVVQGGALRAEGVDTFAPATSTRPWLAAGLGLASDVVIRGPLTLSYRGAGVFPFVRDQFQFDTSVFHEVPFIALELNAGLSWRFE